MSITRTRVMTVLAIAVALVPMRVDAQKKHEANVQIEVGDSIGLPLPDAKIEVFTFMDGGVFWEWIPFGTTPLAAGINLLRFSYPGFEPSTFSVPVREGTTLSLRVRLQPERDTSGRSKDVVEARSIHAIGLIIEGRTHVDILRRRRILEHRDFESEPVNQFGVLMRRARNTELKVIPATGGTFRVLSQGLSGGSNCPVQVMINGDRRRILPFETFDQLFGPSDAEAIEIFPAGVSVPMAYQALQRGCGMMVVWFRTL